MEVTSMLNRPLSQSKSSFHLHLSYNLAYSLTTSRRLLFKQTQLTAIFIGCNVQYWKPRLRVLFIDWKSLHGSLGYWSVRPEEEFISGC